MIPAPLLLAVAESTEKMPSSETATTIAAATALIALVLHFVGTMLRQSKSDRLSDDQRRKMEERLGAKIERNHEAVLGAIKEHEKDDAETFVRKEVYDADKEHARALAVILSKLDERPRHD